MNGPRSAGIRSAVFHAPPPASPELGAPLDEELDESARKLDELDERIDRELERRRTPPPRAVGDDR
jgi:hypothetical protein